MRLRRRLCRLCECPALDGVVKVFYLDEEKFSEWCLDVMDANLADEFKRGDVICNFCVWDAEFLLNSRRDGALQRFKWWPEPSINRSKSLQTDGRFAAETASPHLVPLKPPSLSDSIEHRNQEGTVEKCLYCSRQLGKNQLSGHMKEKHKSVAIRCQQYHCKKYFHTLDERMKHMEAAHEIPKVRKPFLCIYCGKSLSNSSSLRLHTHTVHSKIEVKCNYRRCISYFKTRAELDSHFETEHRNVEEAKNFSCGNCEFKTRRKRSLKNHISLQHLGRMLKCEKCHKKFSTVHILNNHNRSYHSLKECSICHMEMPLVYYRIHYKQKSCQRCQNDFLCAGKFQSHWETCKDIAFSCDKCGKTFKERCKLDYHINIFHKTRDTWRGLNYKGLGFECEPCKRYYSSAFRLNEHFKGFHNLKYCAHCPRKFGKIFSLINHLATKHDLIERKHQCQQCMKKFINNDKLKFHIKVVHNKNRDAQTCGLCGKLVVNMAPHMMYIHGVRI